MTRLSCGVSELACVEVFKTKSEGQIGLDQWGGIETFWKREHRILL